MLRRAYRSDIRNRARAARGDTLIEVIIAITIFSLILVSAMVMMNQGVATSQRALEITLARQAIDAQADTLRFLQAAYVRSYPFNPADTNAPASAREYYTVIQRAGTQASAFGTTTCGTLPSGGFMLNTRTATMVTTATVFRNPTTFAQQHYTGTTLTASDGLWIEGVRSSSSGGNAGYIDFHIRACWAAAGSSQPMNLGTIVRLYEPRG